MGERTLTDADIAAIGREVAAHQICALGLCAEDAQVIKGHLRMFRKARDIVGTVILTTLAIVFLGIFASGFWAWLNAGMRKGAGG